MSSAGMCARAQKERAGRSPPVRVATSQFYSKTVLKPSYVLRYGMYWLLLYQ